MHSDTDILIKRKDWPAILPALSVLTSTGEDQNKMNKWIQLWFVLQGRIYQKLTLLNYSL